MTVGRHSGDSHNFITKKKLGIYYTPHSVARSIVAWAVSENTGPILDPSFGGCAFLHAALAEYKARAIQDGPKLVYGYDIDKSARRFSQQLIEAGVPEENLVFRDFISQATMDSDAIFAAAVGNPPYVRHHLLSPGFQQRAQALTHSVGATIPRSASLWAYFVVLSTAKVRRGGRLAMVLPGTFLHADYARSVIKYLEDSYGSLHLVHVRKRLFDDAQEETVIILGAGKGGTSHLQYVRANEAQDLEKVIAESTPVEHADELSYKRALVPKDSLDAWQEAMTRGGLTSLGDVCKIRIGVVTGANEFFVRGFDDPILQDPTIKTIPILTSARSLSSPIINRVSIGSSAARKCRSVLLCITSRGRRGGLLDRELRSAEAKGVSLRYKCRIRKPWYRIDDVAAPDLFLPYMGSRSPTAIVNRAHVTSTNSIHRLFLLDRHESDPYSMAFFSFTTLFALSAELFGRHYGGGILKVEPSAAMRLPILAKMHESSPEALLRNAETREHSDLNVEADELMLRKCLRLSKVAIAALTKGYEILRRERKVCRAYPAHPDAQ